MTFALDREYEKEGKTMQAEREPKLMGVDEAGRGSLFSRIYAAAVVLPDDWSIPVSTKKKEQVVLRDSKKMTALQRQRAREFIETHAMFGVGFCDEKEIDIMGISHCNVLAMHRAMDDLLLKHPDVRVDKVMVDGVLFRPHRDIPYELVVRGESEHPEIAAASILAKTHRDDFICGLCNNDERLSKYCISSNKGYGAAAHIKAIQTHGPHPLHRKSFLKNFYCPNRLRFLTPEN